MSSARPTSPAIDERRPHRRRTGIRPQRGGIRTLRRTVLCVVLAIGTTCVTISVALWGTMLTTASELVNMIFEPFSLFLVPGLVTAMISTNLQNHLAANGIKETHDFSKRQVFENAIVFYLIVFFLFFWRRTRARHASGYAPSIDS